jgi:hypothetical protein
MVNAVIKKKVSPILRNLITSGHSFFPRKNRFQQSLLSLVRNAKQDEHFKKSASTHCKLFITPLHQPLQNTLRRTLNSLRKSALAILTAVF